MAVVVVGSWGCGCCYCGSGGEWGQAQRGLRGRCIGQRTRGLLAGVGCIGGCERWGRRTVPGGRAGDGGESAFGRTALFVGHNKHSAVVGDGDGKELVVDAWSWDEGRDMRGRVDGDGSVGSGQEWRLGESESSPPPMGESAEEQQWSLNWGVYRDCTRGVVNVEGSWKDVGLKGKVLSSRKSW